MTDAAIPNTQREAPPSRRFPLWWVLAAVVVLPLVLALAAYVYSTSKHFAPALVVSRETTYITEPLTPEGLPDYVAYLNQRTSQGVTPENNAAVLLLRALGPRPDGERINPEVFRLLGVPWPEEGAESYVSVWRQLELLSRNEPLAAEQTEKLRKELLFRPWRSEENRLTAQAARLLKKQSRLSLVVQASRRRRFFVPVVPRGKPLLETDFSVLQAIRGPIRDLSMRAMWHLGHGRPQQAWEDLLAVKRLGILVGQHWSLVGMLMHVAIQGSAYRGIVQLLEHSPPDEATALKWLRQWRQHRSQASFARVLDEGERLLALDSLLQLRSSNLKGLGDQEIRISPEALDWNLMMRKFNHRYDQLVAFDQFNDPHALELVLLDWQQQARKRENNRWLSLLVPFSRTVRSELVSDVLLGMYVTALDAAKVAELRARQWDLLIETALALAAYRARHGNYPEKLDALVPELLPKLPADLFAPGKTLIYRREGDGYVLYSVYKDGVDDGGDKRKLDLLMDLGFRISGISRARLPLVAPKVAKEP